MYKRISVLFLALSALFSFSCGSSNGSSSKKLSQEKIKRAGVMHVASFNIRNSAAQDGDNSWVNRKELVAHTIRSNNMELLGMQEVMPNQLEYLSNDLKEYGWCGLPREDGKSEGEYAPVFFQKKRFELLADSTLWLSETPNVVGSKSWNSACTRIVTWARLKEKNSGIEFYFVNTHFDHQSVLAREESAKLLLRLIRDKAKDYPVILSGDFNMTEKEKAYDIMVESWKDYPRMFDVGKMAVVLEGPDYTFQAFDDNSSQRCKIDFLFVNRFIKAGSQKVLKIKKNNLFVSDHYPLMSDVTFTMGIQRLSESEHVMKQRLFPPFMKKGDVLFSDSTLVSLGCWMKEPSIFYSIESVNGTKAQNIKYSQPFWISRSCSVKMWSELQGAESSRSSILNFYHAYLPQNNSSIKIIGQQKIKNNGKEHPLHLLLDGKRAKVAFQDKQWIGLKGDDLEMTIDLGSVKSFRAISLGCLQSQRDWIFLPHKIIMQSSLDGSHFKSLGQQQITSQKQNDNILVKDITLNCEGKSFRYLKLKVQNLGVCPSWHRGAGDKAWMFVDELIFSLKEKK